VGREANCTCIWNGKRSTVKALIEPPELILRGDLRRRVPLAKLQAVKAEDDQLRFTVGGESVSLSLGSSLAAKWAEAILKPPPSLAKKLGIKRETTVRMIGPMDDAALREALDEARSISQREADLVLARIDTLAELRSALKEANDQLNTGIPIWFIYRKGSGHPLNENLVRSTALAAGVVDTKVASVSPVFTALRFVRRRG
jgi:hypothetical protein